MSEFPVVCVDCRRRIGNKHETYMALMTSPIGRLPHLYANGTQCRRWTKVFGGPEKWPDSPDTMVTPKQALDFLGVKAMCCRAKFLTYVDIPDASEVDITKSVRVEFVKERLEVPGVDLSAGVPDTAAAIRAI